MDSLRRLVEHFRREGHVIRQAPYTFGIAIVLVGAIIFGGVEWHDSGTESALRATNDMLREELKGVSPWTAAEQEHHAHTREKLQEFYVASGVLANRSFQNRSLDDSKESQELDVAMKKWVKDTELWIQKNMGDAARLRFLDNGGYVDIDALLFRDYTIPVDYNLFSKLRRNLQEIIENPAWDAPNK